MGKQVVARLQKVIAQLVERTPDKREVDGSISITATQNE